ncbi:unnamed protein product [Acanthoscelides obtectus]|uniref:ADP-ribosylhydrolase ARH3 n=1 Tax=Acanthoscelides obtectus TaxID=200917 RepID=A0A9P0LFA8_ACAOB|nr:unnamed protein product [Acanthoscelides obtectus]CAK1649792.1 Poly(ADP-ribose) glycohydrolase ARH3 [Acanthoscelides obtectus]
MTILKKFISLAAMESVLLKSKFRGSLLGAVIGDCTGAPFEGDTITSGDKIVIQRYFDKLEDPEFKAPFKPYTDDTAMTKSVVKFLTDKPEPDYKFLARLFVNEYMKEPRRGYGAAIGEVFNKMRLSKFDDVFKPATEQFQGKGSYGNGGAMRVAPIALYYHDNYDAMLGVATKATKLTHTNTFAIHGALLQCIAVREALLADPKKKLDPEEFVASLQEKMKKIENANVDRDLESSSPEDRAYQDKLKIVEDLIGKSYEDLDEEVIFQLGNGISAYESVPTAIHCFLRAQNDIARIETGNQFRRTIQYAISLGGDTDTIASMAGAIAGAYLGEEAVNSELIRHCEFTQEMTEVADNLLSAKGEFPK